MAAEGRDVAESLDQVRLALTVRPDEGRDPRLELDVDLGVRPEVEQREVGDVHQTIMRPGPTA